jgi:hypothetical protein
MAAHNNNHITEVKNNLASTWSSNRAASVEYKIKETHRCDGHGFDSWLFEEKLTVTLFSGRKLTQ